MPLFEYRCRDCGYEFEALVVGTRKAVCPKCRSEDLEKKVSAFGLSATSGWGGRSSGGCGSGGGGG